MRPTFMGFETARRGLVTFQKGLDIAGQNMTNVDTPGYTRQRVDQVSVAFNSGDKFGNSRISLAGEGVMVSGIAQIRDSFLDKRFREEFSDAAYFDKAAAIIEDIGNALDEVGGKGLASAIKSIWESLKDLQGNKDQVTHANIVTTAAKNLTQLLNQFDTKLNDVAAQQKFDMGIDINEINRLLEGIHNLNTTIAKDLRLSGPSGSSNYGPNELLDQRNLLLDELSKYGDIRVTAQNDGTVQVEMNGHQVVGDGKYETVLMVENRDGTVSVNWQSTGDGIRLTTGSLKASIDLINGRGSNAKPPYQGYEKGILYYKDKVDAFARTFANTFNSIMVASDGSYKTLFVSSDENPIGAGNIEISDQWSKSPAYIITDLQGGDGYNNTFIEQMIAVFDKDLKFPADGEVDGEFFGTFNEYVTFYNASIGQEQKFYYDRYETTAGIADELLSRRDAISGVNYDEEATNLMLQQKAYQACSRLMTAMDEALDILINRTGLVGR